MLPYRDDVFVAGGQPTITYVDRQEFHVERNLARALATPNQIVSLAGPTKTGKTVLCKKALGNREYIWIDGGELRDAPDVWARIAAELNIPHERVVGDKDSATVKAGVNIPFFTAGGSQLFSRNKSEVFRVNDMTEAMIALVENRIVLVIDDFHYLATEARTEILRNIKSAVFNGLKVLLLSVTHRVFDAISAETELTGRFISVLLPEWTHDELRQIPVLGFDALAVDYTPALVDRLVTECQLNPFLIQKFCWEICFDHRIERASLLERPVLSPDYDLDAVFNRLAEDSGLPIYQKLVTGPQSRKERMKRPLRAGGEADIYEVTLLALAETGPKSSVSYEELRGKLNFLLTDMVPQKHEITSALKHLAAISTKSGMEAAIDWDEDKREINLADPYLRFYLRWQVRSTRSEDPELFTTIS